MKRLLMLIPLGLVVLLVAAWGAGSSAELISPDAYVEQYVDVNAEHLLIDVRTPSEFASGYIDGAINIPVDQIANRLSEIPSDIPIVVYCRSGNRSATAARTLVENGYEQVYDMGGVIGWTNAGYDLQ